MNLGIFALLTLVGIVGLALGIKMKNMLLIVLSSILALCFGVLVISTFLLVNRLDSGLEAYGKGNKAIEISTNKLTMNDGTFTYPSIKGTNNEVKKIENKLNQKIIADIMNLRNDDTSSLNGNYSIQFFNGRILGIRFEGDSFTPDSAYPNKIDAVLHYDMKTGELYTFHDLMNGSIHYTEEIKNLIKTDEGSFRTKNSTLYKEWTYEDFVTSWDGEEVLFSIKDQSGVHLYFYTSNATGYASGYDLSYQALNYMVNKNGSFYTGIMAAEPVDLLKASYEKPFIVKY